MRACIDFFSLITIHKFILAALSHFSARLSPLAHHVSSKNEPDVLTEPYANI
jgi:hypothetical protein